MSKNFTLGEMLASTTGTSLKIDNTPTEEIKANIVRLIEKVLQPVRDLWCKPIQVNSGYRCPALNKAVGGASASQHLTGKAADITAGSVSANKELFNLIAKSGIEYDQLIDEYDYKWIHISYNEGKNRKQILHLK